ncbi:hypothetical protein [Polyangium aurulentum]|uniref:hypothetical protein n=1 Tax=Polyangium aurulentum TaxID=2567896 RepID=UPI0010AEDF3A|nr:hypothetical protein [Polyangium aurulentum]
MTESGKKARSIPILAAAVLFVPAVGAGVFVGRSIPERRPPATETGTGSRSNPLRFERRELADCQEKLAAPPEALAAPSTTGAPAEDGGRDAGRAPSTVEELGAELGRCKKSTRLVNAEVCIAAARQFDALMALPKNGLACGPKSRAGDLIEENFERCDDFVDPPAGGSEDLTKEEAALVAEATRVERAYPAEEVRRRLKEFVFTCTEMPPQYPPGLDWSKRPKRRETDGTPQPL